MPTRHAGAFKNGSIGYRLAHRSLNCTCSAYLVVTSVATWVPKILLLYFLLKKRYLLLIFKINLFIYKVRTITSTHQCTKYFERTDKIFRASGQNSSIMIETFCPLICPQVDTIFEAVEKYCQLGLNNRGTRHGTKFYQWTCKFQIPNFARYWYGTIVLSGELHISYRTGTGTGT